MQATPIPTNCCPTSHQASRSRVHPWAFARSFENLCQSVDLAGADRKASPARWSMICGMGAGLGEALLWTAPTERLKVLRQSTAGTGTGGASSSVRSILAEQGIGGLYVGAVPTAMRQASSTAVRFAVLDYLRTLICGACDYDKARPPSWVTFISGGLGACPTTLAQDSTHARLCGSCMHAHSGSCTGCSLALLSCYLAYRDPHFPCTPHATLAGGAASVVLNNPIDVVKSRIQSGAHRGGIISCLQELYAERGLAAFTAGLQVRCIRLFASQAIQFTIVDRIMRSVKASK